MNVQNEGFFLYLSRRGLKQSSIVSYEKILKLLVRECDPLSVTALDQLMAKLRSQGRKATYLNRLIDVVRVWGTYTGESELQKYPYFKEEEYIKAVMSDAEIEAFLSLPKPPNTNQENWDTWTLFFSIMAFTGCRCGEAAKLTPNDVDFGQGVFIFRDTKTHETRFVPIPVNIRQQLEQHVQTHCKTAKDYLFPSKRGGNKDGLGKHIDSVDWHYNFHSRIKRLGIKRENLTPYSLRHSFITAILPDSNLFDVKRLVGHKNSKTTEHYYHYNFDSLRKAQNNHKIIRRQTEPQEVLRSLAHTIKQFALEKDTRLSYTLLEDNECMILEVRIK